jgi:hypothetical protein
MAFLEQTLKTMFLRAGHLEYMIHSVKFQKRGLLHLHILCKFGCECTDAKNIDSIVSAEMPSDLDDQELVKRL